MKKRIFTLFVFSSLLSGAFFTANAQNYNYQKFAKAIGNSTFPFSITAGRPASANHVFNNHCLVPVRIELSNTL
jgi:hypothetical protein